MEMNVPHDREARMHEQKPFSGFIKAREGHGKGGDFERENQRGAEERAEETSWKRTEQTEGRPRTREENRRDAEEKRTQETENESKKTEIVSDWKQKRGKLCGVDMPRRC
ncbi:hypothetical protein NC652_026227 [Populus alba x Populus x berolinensis]|nr:hypothetical protein NC652_026227 [Populus alba x Populus x berolinensis]